MKHIRNFSSFNQDEPVNESVRGIVTSILFGLSSMLSSAQSDIMDPSNPIGMTSPISPLNPNGTASPLNPNGIYNHDVTTLKDMREDLLEKLDSVSLKDPDLIKIKEMITRNSIDTDAVNQKLLDYCKKHNIEIDREVFNLTNTKDQANIKLAIEELKEIAAKQNDINAIKWFIIICVIILLITLLIILK
jgi:hypothetical protein